MKHLMQPRDMIPSTLECVPTRASTCWQAVPLLTSDNLTFSASLFFDVEQLIGLASNAYTQPLHELLEPIGVCVKLYFITPPPELE